MTLHEIIAAHCNSRGFRAEARSDHIYITKRHDNNQWQINPNSYHLYIIHHETLSPTISIDLYCNREIISNRNCNINDPELIPTIDSICDNIFK